MSLQAFKLGSFSVALPRLSCLLIITHTVIRISCAASPLLMMSLFQFVEENDVLSQVLLTADHYRIPTFSQSPNLANSLTIMETLWQDLSRAYFILAVISSDLI